MGRFPGQVAGVIHTALNRRERPALARQVHAGLHGVEADKFHHLRDKFLPLLRAVADTGMVHQVGESHHAQPNAAGAVRRFL